MPPLVKIRSERDRMSAIERRIADFILENSVLLRDYSSQQLASALGISQSSVVKFSQKFGFKGYPDLKYSIGEALARNGSIDAAIAAHAPEERDDFTALAADLRRRKHDADEETLLINSRGALEEVAALLDGAGKVFVCGLGEDGLYAREFSLKLSLLGMFTVHHADAFLMMANLSAVESGDALLVFSEHGKLPDLSQISHQFQDAGGKVISITRHTSNPLRALADAALLVSAHDPTLYIEQMLYRSALQQLLDLLFVMICNTGKERRQRLDINLEQMQKIIHS